METKIILSKDFCNMEAIKYVAERYRTTTEKVLEHYFAQTGIIKENSNVNGDEYDLEPNEIALFRDLGVQPSVVEIQ